MNSTPCIDPMKPTSREGSSSLVGELLPPQKKQDCSVSGSYLCTLRDLPVKLDFTGLTFS